MNGIGRGSDLACGGTGGAEDVGISDLMMATRSGVEMPPYLSKALKCWRREALSDEALGARRFKGRHFVERVWEEEEAAAEGWAGYQSTAWGSRWGVPPKYAGDCQSLMECLMGRNSIIVCVILPIAHI